MDLFLLTEQKYKGSYEKVGRLVNQYCTNKGLDTINFFELVLFCYLTGNNDMHLKNFSVTHHSDRTISLSPAYDLVNVNLVFPDDSDELALTLNGRKRKIVKADFDAFAMGIGLPERAVLNIYTKFAKASGKVKEVIESSFLPTDWKKRYAEIWDKKLSILL